MIHPTQNYFFRRLSFCLAAVLGAVSFSASQVTPQVQSPWGWNVCSDSENWSFPHSGPQDLQKSFDSFLANQHQLVTAFAQGLAIQNDEIGEYWMSRALFSGHFLHAAMDGFSAIAARDPTVKTLGVELAALDCMLQIHEKNPSLFIPDRSLAHLEKYSSLPLSPLDSYHQNLLWKAALQKVQSQLANSTSPQATDLEATLSLLKGAGPYENLARAWISAQANNHLTAVQESEKFLAASIPSDLQKYVDSTHMIGAHSYYRLGRYDHAADHLLQVNRNSNEFADALSQLSWAYLMDGKYPESIGTADNLQAGGLKRTFEPEAPMVMAMALNELCQYPPSVHAIDIFKKLYQPSHDWLVSWAKHHRYPNDSDLYALAIDYLKNKSKAPERVATQWIRSPVFISHQDEINLIYDEKESTQAVAASAPAELKKILAHYQKEGPKRVATLRLEINNDLADRNQTMLMQLEEIADNIQLIEVEIYNGASQDMIWQNAHPDYQKLALQMQSDQSPGGSTVWDWGRAPAENNEHPEIWEDELGWFKANLFDNCSSKDKYLALKIQQRREK